MKTILVPLDGSPAARQALRYAQTIAHALTARMHLLRVVTRPNDERLLLSALNFLQEMGGETLTHQEYQQHVWRRLCGDAERYLEVHAAPLRHNGLDVSFEVRTGPPAETIVAVAARKHAGSIVMATHAYSGVQRWMLGSVADRVVRATALPVMMIREEVAHPLQSWALRRILVPLDGSLLAQAALPHALELATHARAEVLLLRAIPPQSLEFHPEHVQRSLYLLADELKQPNLSITTHIAFGDPPAVIAEESARHQVDLIVMATHGYSGVQRWNLGSVADAVLHATTIPVMLVRAPGYSQPS